MFEAKHQDQHVLNAEIGKDSPNNLEPFWMPFTPSMTFEQSKRILSS